VDQPFEANEIVFYLCVYGMAFLSGCSRLLVSSAIVTCRNLFAVGLNSGFLGFAVVSILCRTSESFAGSEFFYLGVAAVIGLAGKEQERIISILWQGLLGKFGITERDRIKSLSQIDDEQIEQQDQKDES
jgi:hypothetical protein